MDEFVRLRALLSRRHIKVGRDIKSISSRHILYGSPDDKLELSRKEGEKEGLCYALKALDKICQTEMEWETE